LAVFVLASALCGLSPSPSFLISSRVLQAVGAALLTPSSLSLVLLAFPAAKRPIAVALWGAVGGLAAAIGPGFGSFIVDHFGWQSAFYVNVPIGLIALYRGVRALQESRPLSTAAFPDIFGTVFLAISIGLIALGAVKLNTWGIGSVSTIVAFFTGIFGLALFVHRSARIAAPTVDLTLFRNSTYRTANLATFIFGIVFTMMFFGFFFFVTSIWGYSLTRAGLSITPGPMMVVPTAIIAGRIAVRTGHRLLLVGGGLLFALGGLWFLLVPSQESNYLTTWLPGTIITGISVGLLIPSLTGAAVFGLPTERFGVGIAINSAIRQLASVFGVVFTILLVGSPQPQIHQFHILYMCLISGGIVISLICVRINTFPRMAPVPRVINSLPSENG
jgi:MFS family permease